MDKCGEAGAVLPSVNLVRVSGKVPRDISASRAGLSRHARSELHCRSRRSHARRASRTRSFGFTRRLGFETVAATLVIDHFLGEAEFITVDNTPRGVSRDTSTDREDGARDPVMQHCKRNSMPIIWDQDTYVEQRPGRHVGGAGPLRLRRGIAMALHMPEGRHFVLGRRPRSAGAVGPGAS